MDVVLASLGYIPAESAVNKNPEGPDFVHSDESDLPTYFSMILLCFQVL
jgi:hypothetical protein